VCTRKESKEKEGKGTKTNKKEKETKRKTEKRGTASKTSKKEKERGKERLGEKDVLVEETGQLSKIADCVYSPAPS